MTIHVKLVGSKNIITFEGGVRINYTTRNKMESLDLLMLDKDGHKTVRVPTKLISNVDETFADGVKANVWNYRSRMDGSRYNPNQYYLI